MHRSLRPRILLASLALPSLAAAQSTPLAVEGDVVPGVGTVELVSHVDVNDAGDWLVQVRTDGGWAVLRDGAVLLQEGDPLGAPAGVYQGFGSQDLNAALEGAFADDDGVYFGTTPLVLDDALTGAPAFSAGTFYSRFFDLELNDARQVLASVALEDPAIAGIVDRTLMLLQADATGALLSETAVVKEGDAIAGVANPVLRVPEIGNGFALNASGQVLSHVLFTDLSAALLLGQTVVVQEGDPAPEFGLWWTELEERVDLNDAGDAAWIGWTGDGVSLAKRTVAFNGQKVASTGDEPAAIAPHALTGLGTSHPVAVDAEGRVAWYGDWDDPDATRDSGVFRNHELVLQEGVSLAAGQPIDLIYPVYELSDDGRYLGYLAELADGRTGAFRLDLEPAVAPYQGCTPTPAQLDVGGSPEPGATLGLQMDGGQADGVVGYVGVATATAAGFPPCGVAVPGIGELLIADPIAVVELSPWFSALPSFGSLPVPEQLALVGADVYLQGAFLDLAGVAPGEPVRLSGGVAVHVGVAD